MASRPKHFVKVRIPIDLDSPLAECVWAAPVGPDQYRIENLVFFTAEVGLHDVVLALTVDDDMPEFIEVVKRHTHVRFVFDLPPSAVRACIDEVDRLGLPCEGADGTMFVINLPDRSLAREAQDLIERHAVRFERVDHEGAAVG